MNKLSLTKLAAGCFFAASAATVQAAPVTWQYVVTLEWGTGSNGAAAPTFSGSGGNQFVSETLIAWGQPGSDLPGSGRSGVEITNAPATGSIEADGTAQPTNILTHYNNVVSSSYGTLKTATLIAGLELWDGGTLVQTMNNDFVIHFVETPNTAGTCLPDSVSVCDDVFVLGMGALNYEFEYDNNFYYLSIFEASNALKPLPTAACLAAGTAAPCGGFMTEENKANVAQLAFSITTEPVSIDVPEPGVLALLGIGLLGIGAMRRRHS